MAKKKTKKEIQREHMLKPKFETVGKSKKINEKIKDSKGKEHDASYQQYTEKMPDNKHLVKFAPKFYYCPDNNMVFEVILSVQYTWQQFLEQTAKQAVNVDEVIKEGHKFKKKWDDARLLRSQEKNPAIPMAEEEIEEKRKDQSADQDKQ